MSVNYGNGIRVRDRYLVGLDSHKLAITLMQLMHGEVSSTPSAFVQQPQVGELRQKGSGYVLDLPVPDIWKDEEEKR